MGSMIREMDARMAACEDFDTGANANPYQFQTDVWNWYEDEYQAQALALVTFSQKRVKGVPDGTSQI